MQQAKNAVTGLLLRAWWRAHAKTANINRNRSLNNVRKHAARNDDPRVWTSLSGGVFNMFPNQRAAARCGVNIQEQQWHGWFGGEPLQVNVSPVVLDMIDAHEPRVFRVG